jgi:cation diffusion facilitator family transporter
MSTPNEVRRVLIIVLALNLGVTAVKLAVGLTSGALAVVADAFHSVVDASSNIIALLGVWAAARPADANHPYGHQKYESIATLGIGGMLLVAAFEIGRGVVERLFFTPAVPIVTPLTFGLIILTFFVNLGVTAYETRAGRRLKSDLLLADAAHTRADLFITLSVLAALAGARLNLPWLDPLVAGGVVVLLFRAAFGILRSTSEVLTDVAVADPGAVVEIAAAVPGVASVSSVRSRGRADAAYVDLNIRVNPAMGADQAHGVASEVEHRLAAALPGVVDTVVHVEPDWEGSDGTRWEHLALVLRKLADGQGLGLHDLHAHMERDGGYSVEAHLELRADLSLSEAHAAADFFEARAREALPDLRALVTHLEPLPTDLPDEAGPLTEVRAAALRARLTAAADELAGAGACHNVELHSVGGRLTATLHITQPGELPLVRAHALAERVEASLHAREPGLNRVVVHVEPPE